MNKRYFITADTIDFSSKVIDIAKVNKQVLAASSSEEDTALYNSILDVKSWLPPASKVYNISANIEDYVVVPVPIFITDLPNRNGIAFPLKDLLEFNADAGCVAYKTWKGKPVYVEHKNDVLKESRGVIFDSVLKPAPEFEGDLYKVILLVGVDRTKDNKLYNNIVNKVSTCYSMGAYADDFKCSVCGALTSKGGCNHVSQFNPNFSVVDGKLTFLNAVGCMGFEISSVATPAFVVAQNPECIEISKIKG